MMSRKTEIVRTRASRTPRGPDGLQAGAVLLQKSHLFFESLALDELDFEVSLKAEAGKDLPYLPEVDRALADGRPPLAGRTLVLGVDDYGVGSGTSGAFVGILRVIQYLVIGLEAGTADLPN